ncbi:MAG: hypothetical protein QMD53_05025 [Actinomycetota bacterium]|nr:hypothetical protein [Actinomycetota bacterium]
MSDKTKVFTGAILITIGALALFGGAFFGLLDIVGVKYAFLMGLFFGLMLGAGFILYIYGLLRFRMGVIRDMYRKDGK